MRETAAIRACRRLVLSLAVFSILGLALPVILWISGVRNADVWTFAEVGLMAAIILIPISVMTSHLKCPGCRKSYFTSGDARHQLLRCSVPFFRRPCARCGCDAFRSWK